MRHESAHISPLVANAGNVPKRAIGIRRFEDFARGIAILPKNLIVRLEPGQRGFIGEVTAFTMRDGKAQHQAGGDSIREDGIRIEGFQIDVLASELKGPIANQSAGQKARFAKNLKPIANAEDEAALRRELLHRLHDRAESRDCAAPQIIAVSEAARHDHRIGVAQRRFLVPDKTGGMPQDLDGVNGILIAVRRGELEDGEIHGSEETQDCIKLLDFSFSSIGWRRRLGRGGPSLLVSPAPEPTPSPLPGGEPATGASKEAPLLGGAGGGFRGARRDSSSENSPLNPLPARASQGEEEELEAALHGTRLAFIRFGTGNPQ